MMDDETLKRNIKARTELSQYSLFIRLLNDVYSTGERPTDNMDSFLCDLFKRNLKNLEDLGVLQSAVYAFTDGRGFITFFEERDPDKLQYVVFSKNLPPYEVEELAAFMEKLRKILSRIRKVQFKKLTHGEEITEVDGGLCDQIENLHMKIVDDAFRHIKYDSQHYEITLADCETALCTLAMNPTVIAHRFFDRNELLKCVSEIGYLNSLDILGWKEISRFLHPVWVDSTVAGTKNFDTFSRPVEKPSLIAMNMKALWQHEDDIKHLDNLAIDTFNLRGQVDFEAFSDVIMQECEKIMRASINAELGSGTPEEFADCIFNLQRIAISPRKEWEKDSCFRDYLRVLREHPIKFFFCGEQIPEEIDGNKLVEQADSDELLYVLGKEDTSGDSIKSFIKQVLEAIALELKAKDARLELDKQVVLLKKGSDND